MSAVDASEIRFSACPHDCPSTCALEIERLDPWRIGRVRGAAANDYTAGVVCSKVARYAERAHHPDRLTRPLRRTARGTFAPIGWDEALDEVAGAFQRAAERYGSETVLALLLRGHDGAGAARWDQPAPPCDAIFRPTLHDLHHPRLERVHRRNRAARRDGPARNGEIRSRDYLGDQRGEHPSQRDDPCAAGAARTGREDRVHRRVSAGDRKAGGRSGLRAPRNRRRARVRADARAVPRRPCGPGVSGALHRLPGRARIPPGGEDSRVGIRNHRGPGRHHRDTCKDDRNDAADLLPARLRFLAAAKRRGQHACGPQCGRGLRCMAARGGRRLPQ